MKKNVLKSVVTMLVICIFALVGHSNVQAEMYEGFEYRFINDETEITEASTAEKREETTEESTTEKQEENTTEINSCRVNICPEIVEMPVMTDGKAFIQWSDCFSYVDRTKEKVFYEVELADNARYEGAKQYSTDGQSLLIDKSEFGKHGGRFYVRVRGVIQSLNETSFYRSEWSMTKEVIFVSIDKTNFPGMYEVLKNGGKRYDISANKMEKVIYDENEDGWLDPAEIDLIRTICTANTSKKVKGVNKIIKATDISSFEGVEYLYNLHSIHVERFSGKKADLSKTSVNSVWITGVSSKQITVVAPNAENVHVEADYNAKMAKMDLSKCNNAVEIDAYGGTQTKTLKLPKNKKNLKVLSVSDIKIKSLNVNGYTKLQQLYVYDCDVKSVKVNKCKDLRYIYFWYCDNIKSLNLKSNTKLRGADFYETPGLTASTIKKAKKGKYTWNKGKWWYSTSAYKKDMNNMYQ